MTYYGCRCKKFQKMIEQCQCWIFVLTLELLHYRGVLDYVLFPQQDTNKSNFDTTMKQPQKIPSESSSMICHAFQIILFVLVILTAMLPIIYELGSEETHQDIPHSLNQIFHTPKQEQIFKQLLKKKYRHAILQGEEQSGLFQFLQYYADERAEKGKAVVVRRNNEDGLEVAFKLFRETKDFIQQNLDIEEDSKRAEWVFLIKSGEIPVEQIQRILAKHPKHRILVGTTQKQIQIDGFKKLEYPGISLLDLEALIAKQFQIPDKQAAILVNHYGTIQSIFEHLDKVTYSHKQHLGEQYFDLEGLSDSQMKLLKKLCQKGTTKAKDISQSLENAGVIAYKKKAYWYHRQNILNYELQTLSQCKYQVIPEQILEMIHTEPQTEEEQKQEQRQEADKKKKSKKKNTK